MKKVWKSLHPKIWTNPATRVLTFYHGGLAGTPQPLGNNSSSEFITEFVKLVYTSVADPGEGPGGFRPNRGPKGEKIFLGDRPPPPYLTVWKTAPNPPSPLPTISRSGSGTTISILNFWTKGHLFCEVTTFTCGCNKGQIDLFWGSYEHVSSIYRSAYMSYKVSPLELPTSRAQIFPQAQSVSGRFFILRQKRAREREHFALGLSCLPVVILSKVSNYSWRACLCPSQKSWILKSFL